MVYTVKKLSQLSGVSIRTLHFYDEIGLLKPAYYGDNQYRYYEEEQLLALQQILFFRELGVSLKEIQEVLTAESFDRVDALASHRSILVQNIERQMMLVKTIDKTIEYLRGNIIMKDIEMYEGFDLQKQQEYEKYLFDKGFMTQEQINESWKKVKHWNQNDWASFYQEGDALNKALVTAIKNNYTTESKEVQQLIQQHYEMVKRFWTPTKESYIGLGEMYLAHADFRKYYDNYHPELAEYLVAAMKIFAEKQLSDYR
jgi:DNA-binding transcriptional MerR regulator